MGDDTPIGGATFRTDALYPGHEGVDRSIRKILFNMFWSVANRPSERPRDFADVDELEKTDRHRQSTWAPNRHPIHVSMSTDEIPTISILGTNSSVVQ
jgi:hypothetical protein